MSVHTLTEKLKLFHKKYFWGGSRGKVDPCEWNINFNQPRDDLPSNEVSTSIYNAINFIPKSLGFQFSKPVNLYFLMLGLLQMVPQISPTGGKPITFLPLSIITAIASLKEILEDWKRHKSDKAENNRKTLICQDGEFIECAWKDLRVGHIVKINQDEMVPADILVVNASLKGGLCFIETKDLDGETCLKPKYVHKELIPLMANESRIAHAIYNYSFEKPNEYLYKFIGCVTTQSGQLAMNEQNLILRGSILRNTEYVYGVVTYTGHSSKIMLNSTNSKAKFSKLEKAMSRQILNTFILLFSLCTFAAFYAAVWYQKRSKFLRYLDPQDNLQTQDDFAYILAVTAGSWLLLLSKYVPISLILTVELVRVIQSWMITGDEEMTQQSTKIKTAVQTPNVCDEIGQIEYILTDKTGTLTKNMMDFKKISVAGELYGDKRINLETVKVNKVDHVDFYDPNMKEELENPNMQNHQQVLDCIILIALCHTAVVQEKDGKSHYNTASPDELALVNFAKSMGIEFMGVDETDTIELNVQGKTIKYKRLQVFEFDSDRKRMSVVIQNPDGTLMLYTKGADSIMLERMDDDVDNAYLMMISNQHIHQFSTEGLRTLVLAKKTLEKEAYKKWAQKYEIAKAKISGRDEAMEALQSEIEVDLKIVGVSAVEDKLQDEVGLTIAKFKEAGIKVWMLTGDKVETAINIGYSCHVLDDQMTHLKLVESKFEEVCENLEKMLIQVQSGDEHARYSLVISGEALIHAIKPDLSKKLMTIAKRCCVLIACRVSPKQKQQFVLLIKQDNPKASTLAIGDGANDVYMITAASVGVGIRGLEGQQAARASDFAIAEFKLLRRLLLYHGRENYRRNSYMIIHNFYKNIIFVTVYFWFGFFSGFSGTTFYDKYLSELYNTLFNSAPILVFAAFDNEYTAQKLMNTPKLYIQGIQGKLFNDKVFIKWLTWGIGESFFISMCALGLYGSTIAISPDGYNGEIVLPGIFIFTVVVWLSNVKVLAYSNTYNFIIFFLSLGSPILYHLLYLIAAQFKFTDVYGTASLVYLNFYFYVKVILVVGAIFMISLAHRTYKQVQNPHLMTQTKLKLQIEQVEQVDACDSEGLFAPSSPLKFIDVEQTKESIPPQTPMSPFFKVGAPASFLDTNGTLQSIQPLRSSKEVRINPKSKMLPYPS